MTIFRGLRSIFLGLGALVILGGCQSLLYFPRQDQLFSPEQFHLQYENVYFKSATGESIHGWYFASTQTDSKGTVLFFHGNADNITSHFMMFHWLPSQEYNYLIFDYPGYGQSRGKPTPANTVSAGKAAAEWIHITKDARGLIFYGHSLGGIVAMKVAEEIKSSIPLKVVMIDASFSSYQRMARRILSRSWVTWFGQPLAYIILSDRYSPEPLSQVAPVPMVFIHGDSDPVIEPESSQEMYIQAGAPKELWIVPGGHHGDLYEVRGGELRGKFLDYLRT